MTKKSDRNDEGEWHPVLLWIILGCFGVGLDAWAAW